MPIFPKTNLSLANLHSVAGGVSGTTVSLNDPDIRTLLSTPDYFYAGGSLTAPATTNIFDNWQRFSHYFQNDGVFPAIPTEIDNNTWIKDSDNIGIECTVNSFSYIGFVCPPSQAQENFFMQAEVSNTDPDNDIFSIVIAFLKDTAGIYGPVGNEYTISALRAQNALGVESAWSIMYNFLQADKLTVKASVAPNKIVFQNNDAGWNTFTPLTGSVIQVIREGNTIRCKSSDAGSTTLRDELVYNLSDNPETLKFSGPQQFGFGTYSQRYVLFDNILIGENETEAANFTMGMNSTSGSSTSIGRYRNGTY